MKSLRLFVFAISATILFYSCSKEGPAGPAGAAGPQGAQGPQGPQGTTGTANVIYSAWFNVTAWTNNGSPNIYFDKAAAGVTASVIDQGVVLAYIRFSDETTGARPLPAVTFSGKVIWNYYLSPGNIRFTANTTDGTTNLSAASTMKYRYVIIPGGVAGGRISSSAISYTEEQLKNMSYEEVAKLFNIPEEGFTTK